MPDIVYIKGQFCNAQDAHISVFDRGLLFADSVYEVIPVYANQPFFVDRHLQRLALSLESSKIVPPCVDWPQLFAELIEANGGGDLQIYLQITRGNQGFRKHDIPPSLEPTVFAFTIHTPYPKFHDKKQGLKAKIVEDIRWQRCDIKTTSMLGHVLVNDEAVAAGFNTALLTRGGLLTEGSSSNVFIVNSQGVIRTTPLSNACLAGITRQICIELIQQLNFSFHEHEIPIQDIFSAEEVWITSTTKEIYPVTVINDHRIGKGVGGHYWTQLNESYQQLVKAHV